MQIVNVVLCSSAAQINETRCFLHESHLWTVRRGHTQSRTMCVPGTSLLRVAAFVMAVEFASNTGCSVHQCKIVAASSLLCADLLKSETR